MVQWRELLKSRLLLRPVVEDDPRLKSRKAKEMIIFCLAICACMPGFSSTIYFPGLPSITADLQAPPIATTLTAALFVLFMGIAPVFWASASENYQMRRWLLIVSMWIFAVASLGAALVNNIWGLVVLRCLQSVGASCGQSVGAGVIADCYPIEQRGTAFGKFFFGVFFGPLLGPIIGGLLIMSAQGWRATFWFCLAAGMVSSLVVFFLLPETYRINAKFDLDLPTKDVNGAEKKAVDERHDDEKQAADDSTVVSSPVNADGAAQKDKAASAEPVSAPAPLHTEPRKRVNPIGPFLLLRHPFILIAALGGGLSFSVMFAVETIIPGLYEEKYGFNSWQTGLSYLGAGVGNLTGSLIGGRLSDRLLMRSRRQRGGAPMAEDRLTLNIWPGYFLLMPFGLLLFGWMLEFNKSVWAPIVAFGIVCFGMNQVTAASSAYLVDAMPGQGASATAAANLVRMVMACVLTLVANPMVASLGPGYTSVLLAAVCWVGTFLIFILKIYGQRLRAYSGFTD
ncbi:major facilitator superfamily domain-containing protein [Gongronella butleri]|nr:major facilitator superfamily domain-containing protein [Gongronella butleri]